MSTTNPVRWRNSGCDIFLLVSAVWHHPGVKMTCTCLGFSSTCQSHCSVSRKVCSSNSLKQNSVWFVISSIICFLLHLCVVTTVHMLAIFKQSKIWKQAGVQGHTCPSQVQSEQCGETVPPCWRASKLETGKLHQKLGSETTITYQQLFWLHFFSVSEFSKTWIKVLDFFNTLDPSLWSGKHACILFIWVNRVLAVLL